ncbi:MAG TPA: hypothetical protein VF082_09945 [Jiangellaceae bacterium]
MNHIIPEPGSSDALRRLIRALRPGTDAERGLLVATVTLLGGETSGRLADLVERANADAYDRGWTERDEQ